MTDNADAMAARRAANRKALDTAHLMSDLGRRAATGGVIAVGGRVMSMAVALTASIILARLLRPEDFGLLAMAAAVMGFVALFTDLGLSSAAVQRENLDQNTASGLFYINVAAGGAVMLATMALAPLAAWGFNDSRVLSILLWLAPTILVGAAGAQHTALLVRGMRWMTLQGSSLAAQFVGAATAILLAWKTDVGYWALVAQGWVGAVVGLLISWSACRWRPSRVTDWTGVRAALNFGLNIAGYNFFNYFHRQFDNVLIGWRWGAMELGYYSRAYALLTMPTSLINGPVSTAILPALSRLQGDPERWRRSYLNALTVVTLAGSGLAAVLISTAKPLVMLLYGPGWDETGLIFQYLAISMLFAIPTNTTGWILISLSKSDRLFRWGLFACPIFVLSFVIGLPWGGQGVALAYATAMLMLAPLCFFYSIRGTPLSTSDIAVAVIPFALAAAASAAVGYAARTGLAQESVLPQVCASAAASSVAYLAIAGALVWLFPVYQPLLRRLREWRQ